MKDLTPRQRAILVWLAAQPLVPTLREIGRQFGIASTNGVNDHLVCLEKKGAIVRSDKLSRSIQLTPLGQQMLGSGPIDEPLAMLTEHWSGLSLADRWRVADLAKALRTRAA